MRYHNILLAEMSYYPKSAYRYDILLKFCWQTIKILPKYDCAGKSADLYNEDILQHEIAQYCAGRISILCWQNRVTTPKVEVYIHIDII